MKEVTPEEIRLVMDLRLWSMADLAHELEVSVGAIYRWLDGSRNPNLRVSRKIRAWLAEDKAKQPAGRGK